MIEPRSVAQRLLNGLMQPALSGALCGFSMVMVVRSLWADPKTGFDAVDAIGLAAAVVGAVTYQFIVVCMMAGRVVWPPRQWLISLYSPYVVYVAGPHEAEVDAWCREHCRGGWVLSKYHFVRFNRKSDLAMFTLFWSGKEND